MITQCLGNKKNGARCTAHTSYANGYCFQHQAQVPAPAPAPVPPVQASVAPATTPATATPPTTTTTAPPAPARSNNLPWIIGGIIVALILVLLACSGLTVFAANRGLFPVAPPVVVNTPTPVVATPQISVIYITVVAPTPLPTATLPVPTQVPTLVPPTPIPPAASGCPTTADAKVVTGVDLQRIGTETCAFVWRGAPGETTTAICPSGYVCTFDVVNDIVVVHLGVNQTAQIRAGTWRFIDTYASNDAVHDVCALYQKEKNFGLTEVPLFQVRFQAVSDGTLGPVGPQSCP